jgi:3-oxoadipate enol-lactonase
MPFTELHGHRFYYELQGAGPRLLYFNGSGGDLRKKPGPMDGPLSSTFEVLCHDQRGLGQSDRPDIAYTMADYAEDGAALLDDLGWDRCHVMGVSFGGMVAQEFAIRFPERVEKLVLACTSSGGAGKPSYPLHTLGELPPDERAMRGLELADTRMSAAWREENPEQLETLLRVMAGNDPGAGEPGRELGARRQLEARKDHDTYDRLPAIGAETFCCGGRFDGIAPPANMEAIASRIPNAKLELFEGGHIFLMQDPKAFQRILEFLG